MFTMPDVYLFLLLNKIIDSKSIEFTIQGNAKIILGFLTTVFWWSSSELNLVNFKAQ
jgi:hypothetical protein